MSDPRSQFPDERPEPSSLPEGIRLGHYRVRRRIGRGGMGEVYVAHDEHLDRDVALKVLKTSQPDRHRARDRFRREALALSRLSHPNIATVFDFDTQDGVDFLVMEHVEGETLADRIRRGPLDERELLDLAVQICASLEEAHRHHVLHRDLTPRNVMVTGEGQVKVLDFGLAKLLNPEADDTGPTETISVTRQIAGTVPYISPERLRGERADERADVYSLGAILYEMASGGRLFEGVNRAELLAATLEREPPPLRRRMPGLDPGLVRCIEKALEKDPRQRYTSARDLGTDLKRLRDRNLPRVRPGLDMPVAAGTIVLVVVLVATYFYWKHRQPDAIEVAEVIALVTGPETELASRISPDGRWLSYQTSVAAEGEIRVLPISGGESRRVASVPGDLHGHCWSPDGERIAFVRPTESGSLLQTVPAFGGVVRTERELPPHLGLGAPVEWDGTSIYLDVPGSGLWKLDLEGENSIRLLPTEGEEGYRFEFDVCAEGHWAVFTVAEEERHALWLAKLPSGSPRRLTRGDHSDIRPRWFGSECRWVVHTSNRTGQSDLWRTDLQGRSSRLTFGAGYEYAESGSRDGRLLSYRQETGRSDLWILDPARPEVGARRLTGDSLDDLWPAAARDTRRIAFQRQKRSFEEFDPISESEILVAKVGPESLHDSRSVASRGGLVRMSPSGRWISYTPSMGSASRELVVLDLETGHTITVDRDLSVPAFATLPFGPRWSDVHWSSTEDRLFYVVSDGRRSRIRSLVAGRDPEPHTIVETDRRRLSQPITGADGRTLLYLEERSVAAEGGTERGRDEYRTELHRHSLADGSDRVIFEHDHDERSYVQVLGESGEGRWMVLLNRAWTTEEQAAELLEVSEGEEPVSLLVFEGQVASCRLGPSGDQLFMSWLPASESVQNLYAVDLVARSWRRITDNEQSGTLFSCPVPLADGRLVYTRQDSNSDIWLIRLES